MARRKHIKRIDPRYFLDETVNRNHDGSALEEGPEAGDCGGPNQPGCGSASPAMQTKLDSIGKAHSTAMSNNLPKPRSALKEECPHEDLEEQNTSTHPLPAKNSKSDGRVRAPGTLDLPDDLVRRVPKSELHPAHRVPDDDSDSIPDTIDRELVRTKVDEEFKQRLKALVLQELQQMRERKQNG
jgi:hypothetical protein